MGPSTSHLRSQANADALLRMTGGQSGNYSTYVVCGPAALTACSGRSSIFLTLLRGLYINSQGPVHYSFPFKLPGGGIYMAAEEKKEIVEKVKQIISEQLGGDENEVTPRASFVDDLGADSLDQVELVMALEEHFGVEIPDEDAEKLRTVQDAIGYIDKHAKVSK